MKLSIVFPVMLGLMGCVAAMGARHLPPFEEDILKFEQEDKQNPPVPGGVLFLGSSTIRMWTTLPQDFPDTRLLNRGFGGSHIVDSIRLFDRVVTPYRPRQIFFYAGDNDLASGRSPELVAEDFQRFSQLLHRKFPKTRLVYLAIKPSPSRIALFDKAKDANDRIRKQIKKARWMRFIDTFQPMLDDKGQPRRELFIDDMLHMNAKGYKLWQQLVAPAIIHDKSDMKLKEAKH